MPQESWQEQCKITSKITHESRFQIHPRSLSIVFQDPVRFFNKILQEFLLGTVEPLMKDL